MVGHDIASSVACVMAEHQTANSICVINERITDRPRYIKLRGPYPQKMTELKKNLLMKYQDVANVVVEFYSCATCVKAVWGG